MIETALVLTQEEWDDLAYICSVWLRATESNEGYTEEEIVTQIRRRSLAHRVMDVATP